jgi:HlyD family secretion protein
MKKWAFVFISLGLLVGGWWAIRTFVRVTPPGDEPKLEKIVRGDIRVPITAAGLIEPYERIEIKPEASGEVLKVNVVEGMRVKPGDKLVVIKEDDETRNVEKAEANVKRSEALLEQAKIAVQRAASNVQVADARVDELKANGHRLDIDIDRLEHMEARTVYEQEVLKTNLDMNKAQIAAAEAQAVIARQNQEDATAAVRVQEATLSDAQATERDARTRLSRTTVTSKRDAVITEVKVKEGNIVQSGSASFTGGSILLTMADVSKLKVITRVDEADYGRVAAVSPIDVLPDINNLREIMTKDKDPEKRSGKVQVTVDAFPDRTFAGVIVRVEPQGKLNVGASLIQFDVHVEITDENRDILPLGTQAQVEFTVENIKDVLVVPADAVKQFQNEKGVYIKGGAARDAKPRFIKCRFGITDGASTHLIGALSESDNSLLKEGVEVYTKLPVVREEGDR